MMVGKRKTLIITKEDPLKICTGCVYYMSKLKQTEVECEYLKRCFGSLTEQNRRLLREVEELRALKVGPPTVLSLHTHDPLPSSNSLTMCPRCERVTATTPNVAPVNGPTKPAVPSPMSSGAAC